MGKYIYKTVGLILIFIGALFFFGGRMQTNNEVEGQITTPGKETLPVIRIETLGHVINAMYGYTAPLSDNVIRESVTPIDQNREITLHITPSERRITGISYRITDKGTGEVYADEQVKGIDASQKEVPLKIKYSLATSTEYILDIMATLDDGREVHYYTRIKSYLEDSGIDAKLSFIDEFHQNTFSKNKITDVARYLETDPQARNSNLARVTINSSSDLVTWAGMSPKVISDEYITIKEYNMETAAVLLSYFVRANTNSGTETYFIREYYRVRHTALQDYLLAFERTMEADFDPGVASVSSSQLKLGITSDNKGKLLSTADGKGMYFARNEKVFYYDMTDNTIRQLYQIFSDDNDYLRRAYDTTDIRLVAVDEEDSLFFCALGYLPRGSYEGDIGIILYKYEKDKGVIELVNLPMETSYEQLFIDFENYSYVSPRDVFYFTVANTVYAYNISGQRLEILQKNVKDISFKTMESSNCYVWSSSLGNGYGKSITIYNLENDSHQLIQSPSEDEYIRLLGIIESNVVYGYVRKSDITRDSDGSRIIPCYQLLIADTSGTQVKTYEKDGVYIKNAIGSGNVVNIRLCRKTENGYKNAGEDSILNRSSIKASKFSYTSHLTTKSLTEWYVKFPQTFTMPGKIKLERASESVSTNSHTVRLENPDVMNYYVSAYGRFTKSYEDVKQAISEADKQMGVVISGDHKVVWERSGAFNQNNLGDLSIIKAKGGVTSLGACVAMVLSRISDVDVSAEELSGSGLTAFEMMEQYIPYPLNLGGCTLDQVIYFVSSNKPVIAMTLDGKGVVIGGYTLNDLTIFDPDMGVRNVSRREFEKFFKRNGNRFLSYME